MPVSKMFRLFSFAALLALGISQPTLAQKSDSENIIEAAKDWPEAWFEIFRLAPGKHEEFVRLLDLHDQAAAAADLPPTQVYFHNHGAEWDVLLLKPVNPDGTTDAQACHYSKKIPRAWYPNGPEYFIYMRTLTC